MSVYRKVLVSERLPSEDGVYIVKNENGSFECEYCKEYSFYDEFSDCSGITYWLEEVELPTDQDIVNESNKLNTNERSIGFENGANYVLNKLK